MLQRIDLCKFQPKQAYAVASVASSRWNSQTKMGKSQEMFTTDKKYTRCKRLACRVVLEYCLKDSPCCTEWIDVCYKCTYQRFNMDEYGAIYTWIHVPLYTRKK